jgi:hypothetical protein
MLHHPGLCGVHFEGRVRAVEFSVDLSEDTGRNGLAGSFTAKEEALTPRGGRTGSRPEHEAMSRPNDLQCSQVRHFRASYWDHHFP